MRRIDLFALGEHTVSRAELVYQLYSLVDSVYELILAYEPSSEYGKIWRKEWLEKAENWGCKEE